MGNAPSEEEAAVDLAPGTSHEEQIRSTDEPASAGQMEHTHGNEMLTTSPFRNAGEGEPAEGEGVITAM